MMSGFPANSVFIVDSEDRVRHQTVLDSRFRHFCCLPTSVVMEAWKLDEMAQVKNMMEMLGMIMMLIVNPRVGWNMEEVARLVAAFRLIFITFLCHSGNFVCSRACDGGQGLAMAGWKGEQDTVENQVSTINTFTLIVTNISGRFR